MLKAKTAAIPVVLVGVLPTLQHHTSVMTEERPSTPMIIPTGDPGGGDDGGHHEYDSRHIRYAAISEASMTATINICSFHLAIGPSNDRPPRFECCVATAPLTTEFLAMIKG